MASTRALVIASLVLSGCGSTVAEPDGGPAADAGAPDTGTPLPIDGGVEICRTATATSWLPHAITPAQTERFTAEADVTAFTVPTAAAVALSSGVAAAGDWSALAAIVLFDDVAGTIQARNGAAYDADAVLAYEAGVRYHVRMVVDVTRHTYSVYVTPEDGSEVVLASNYAFRETQQSVTQLDQWMVAAGTGDYSITSCNFAISDAPAQPTIQYGYVPPSQTVYGGSTPIVVPAGYVHQTAWTTGGGPDIEGVYAFDFGEWRSMVWRWADTMRSDAIQHVVGPGGMPAYRIELTNDDHASPGTAGDHPRAEFFSVDPAEDRRERDPPRENIFRDGDEYWATFAIYLAPDFPTTHLWATLIQRKLQNVSSYPVNWFSINAHGDTIDFSPPGSPSDTFVPVSTVTAMRGRWTQFTWHERMSSGSDGYFALYMDGALVGERSGATITGGDINFNIHYGYYRGNEGGPGVGVVHYSPFMLLRGASPGTIPTLP